MRAKRAPIALIAKKSNSKIGRPRYRRMPYAYRSTPLRFGSVSLAAL
jgi:hypothetical protein